MQFDRVQLISKDSSTVNLVSKDVETFLDENFEFAGFRHFTPKLFGDSMVDFIQSTSKTLTIALFKPDGLPFDLTGATSITVGLFQRSPLQETIVLKAGTISGAAVDGLVIVNYTTADTNFVGYATGSVQVVQPSKTSGFDEFECVFRKNRFLP